MQTAGSKFEKQNSGFDMSTQNGMNTTGKFSSIADIVEAVYPVNHPLQIPAEGVNDTAMDLSDGRTDT